jgi:hypothetical protein
MYGYKTKLTEALGRVATFKFEGLAASWWAGLSQSERDEKIKEWPMLWDFVRDNVMSKRWTKSQYLKLTEMRYRQRGYEIESPVEYRSRKQRHRRKLIPIYPGASDAELSYEVAELWLRTPPQWAAHIDATQCHTSAELIKMATD